MISAILFLYCIVHLLIAMHGDNSPQIVKNFIHKLITVF